MVSERSSWRRATLGLIALGASYGLVRTGRAAPIDDAVAGILRRPLGAGVDLMVGTATDLGSVFGLFGTTLALLAAGRREAAIDVAGAGVVAWVVAQGAKPLLDRPRPYQRQEAERLVAVPAGSSWPSGHAAVASAIAVMASDHGGRGAAVTGVGVVGFVAASRIYVGVHHATDPIAGVGIGTLAAAAWRTFRRRW